jgi:hypothetical protein
MREGEGRNVVAISLGAAAVAGPALLAVELLLVTVIGALPGVIVGGLAYDRVRRRDPAVPVATARDAR